MSSQPRVLILNHFAVPREQPGGTRHVELFDRIREWDHLIVAADRNLTTGERQSRADRFAFVRVPQHARNGPSRILTWVLYAVQAVAVGLRYRPDVVYASSPHLLAGVSGWLVAALYKRPLILEIRDMWPQVLVDMDQLREGSKLHRLLVRLERFLYGRASKIISMAPGTSSSLRAMGVPAEKIEYLPNASDPSDFTPSKQREALRVELGFDGLVGVYAGAHGPANGLDLLIDAAQSFDEADLTIVLFGDGLEKERLQRLASDTGSNVIQFREPVPKTVIPDILAAADFGIHVLADVPLFRTSVSPNKIFDYFAAGLPVLTNSPGVVGDMVRAGEAGVIVEPGDLAVGLSSMLNLSAGERSRMGERGRDWLESSYTRTSVADRLSKILPTMRG